MAESRPLHPFGADTAVDVVGGASLAAVVTDRWNVNSGHPNGGYLLAMGTRALTVTLGRCDPIAVTANYLRPGVPGAATIETEVARRGRRVATGEARLRQDGREVIRVIGTFADRQPRVDPTYIGGHSPRLPPPERCVDPMSAGRLPGVTISDQIDYRYPAMPGWRIGHPSGNPRAAFWMRFREHRAPDLLELVCLVDAGAAAVMELGAVGSATVQLSAYLHRVPATQWVACRITTRYMIGGFHDEDVELWDASGAIVAQARQLALVR